MSKINDLNCKINTYNPIPK